MKVIDFENAITALDSSIHLDEVKLYRGHVRRFYGHKGTAVITMIMWNENGEGYARVMLPAFSSDNDYSGLPDSIYGRNEGYDLNFCNTESDS